MAEIEGPLGIWPWPILNALVQMTNGSSEMEITEVHRDSEGRIQSIETVKK